MISIIIPIYNAEKYLRQCIESVMDQGCTSIELLLIDDGSTDSSLAICREYASKDKRIVVIEKSNTGVSDTRNVGIENAHGDYILFVDADDYLVPKALTKIENALALTEPLDILIWGFSTVGDRASTSDNDTKLLDKHLNGFDSQELLSHLISIDSENRFRGLVWRCAFKNTMLNDYNIRFLNHIRMAEDFKFVVDAILVAKHISVLNEELYVYRLNDSSVTARYKPNVHSDMAWVNEWIEQNVCKIYPELQEGLDCCCAETYIAELQNLCNTDTEYGVLNRIRVAWEIKSKFQYSKKVKVACKQWRTLSKRRILVYYMLRFYLEPIYILLYSMKRKTLFRYRNP